MTTPAAAPAAAPTNGTAPRANNGQFAPKAGATGVAAPEGAAVTSATNAPPSGPTTVAEWEGYEGEVDVYGEKVPVKVRNKSEALRAHQELLAYRKRVRDIAEAEKRLAARERMAPEERMAAEGVDVHEHARRKVIEAAKLVDMTPEQRRIYELEQDIAGRDRAAKAAEERQQQEEATAAAKQRRQFAVNGLEKGLEISGLPRTMHVMALLAEIQQECTAQRLPPLPPDLLAAEANKRYNERGVEPLKKLQGKALLDRLGPEVSRAVLLAVREQRGLAAGAPRQESTQPTERTLPAPTNEKVYGEAEAEALLRELRNQRR